MPFAICMVFQIRFVGLGLGILVLGIGPLSDLLLLGSESWLTIRLPFLERGPLPFPYHLLTISLPCPCHAAGKWIGGQRFINERGLLTMFTPRCTTSYDGQKCFFFQRKYIIKLHGFGAADCMRDALCHWHGFG